MKKIILLVLLFCSAVSSYAQNGFIVKVKLTDMDRYKPVLFYSNGGKLITDSISIDENGYKVFKGKVDEPIIANLTVRAHPMLSVRIGNNRVSPGPSLNFVLSNDEIEINGDAATVYMAAVKGGKANDEWAVIKEETGKLTHESWMLLRKIYEEYKQDKDSTRLIQEANNRRTAIAKKTQEINHDFANQSPSSFISMYHLSMMLNVLTHEELAQRFAKLDDTWKNGIYGKRVKAKLEAVSATATGKEAIDFNKKDMDGKFISLSSLKGKYVLLDFWGSWCVPCRVSFPHLKEVYAKYKDKGLEIVGIAQETSQSLAENKKKWKEAIQQDKTPWLHVLNNEDVDQFDIVKAYGVSAFPTSVLLDKEGKVIVRWVGAQKEAMDKKLAELFDQHK